MTRRYLPRVTLSRRLLPLVPAFYMGFMSDEFRQQSATPPALVSNVEFLRLEDENTLLDFDGMPGAPQRIRASAALLPYSIEWLPTSTSSWIHAPSAEEQQARDLDLADFGPKITDLDERIAAAKKEDEQKALREERSGLQSIVDQLKGNGYLRTSYGAMDTRETGVFWGLAAPNIPLELRSAFTLQRDRGISFRLKRFKAPEDQADYSFTLEFEGGQTLYTLTMGEDGNSTEFLHYRAMLPAQREPLRRQMEAIIAKGKLSVTDRKQLLEWDTTERAIRAKAKKRERGEKELTELESREIERLHKQAEDLKQSKHPRMLRKKSGSV